MLILTNSIPIRRNENERSGLRSGAVVFSGPCAQVQTEPGADAVALLCSECNLHPVLVGLCTDLACFSDALRA